MVRGAVGAWGQEPAEGVGVGGVAGGARPAGYTGGLKSSFSECGQTRVFSLDDLL